MASQEADHCLVAVRQIVSDLDVYFPVKHVHRYSSEEVRHELMEMAATHTLTPKSDPWKQLDFMGSLLSHLTRLRTLDLEENQELIKVLNETSADADRAEDRLRITREINHDVNRDLRAEIATQQHKLMCLQDQADTIWDLNDQLQAQVAELSKRCTTAEAQQSNTAYEMQVLSDTVTSNERLLTSRDEQITQLETRIATFQEEREEWITQRKTVHEVHRRERERWTKRLESSHCVITQLEEKLASWEAKSVRLKGDNIDTRHPSFDHGGPRPSLSNLATPPGADVPQSTTVPTTQLPSTVSPPVSAPPLSVRPPATPLLGPDNHDVLVANDTPVTYGDPSCSAPANEVTAPFSESLPADHLETKLRLIGPMSFDTPHHLTRPPMYGDVQPVSKPKRPSLWTHREPPPCKRIRTASWENDRPIRSKTRGHGSARSRDRPHHTPVERKQSPRRTPHSDAPQTGTAQSLLPRTPDPQVKDPRSGMESPRTQHNATDRESFFSSSTYSLELVSTLYGTLLMRKNHLKKGKRCKKKRKKPKPDPDRNPTETNLERCATFTPRDTTVHGSTTLTNVGAPAPKPPDPRHPGDNTGAPGSSDGLRPVQISAALVTTKPGKSMSPVSSLSIDQPSVAAVELENHDVTPFDDVSLDPSLQSRDTDSSNATILDTRDQYQGFTMELQEVPSMVDATSDPSVHTEFSDVLYGHGSISAENSLDTGPTDTWTKPVPCATVGSVGGLSLFVHGLCFILCLILCLISCHPLCGSKPSQTSLPVRGHDSVDGDSGSPWTQRKSRPPDYHRSHSDGMDHIHLLNSQAVLDQSTLTLSPALRVPDPSDPSGPAKRTTDVVTVIKTMIQAELHDMVYSLTASLGGKARLAPDLSASRSYPTSSTLLLHAADKSPHFVWLFPNAMGGLMPGFARFR